MKIRALVYHKSLSHYLDLASYYIFTNLLGLNLLFWSWYFKLSENLFVFFLSWLYATLWFGVTHNLQHTLFIISKETKFNIFTAFAFDHHYYDVNVFAADIRYRTMYFLPVGLHMLFLPALFYLSDVRVCLCISW